MTYAKFLHIIFTLDFITYFLNVQLRHLFPLREYILSAVKGNALFRLTTFCFWGTLVSCKKTIKPLGPHQKMMSNSGVYHVLTVTRISEQLKNCEITLFLNFIFPGFNRNKSSPFRLYFLSGVIHSNISGIAEKLCVCHVVLCTIWDISGKILTQKCGNSNTRKTLHK